MNKNIKKKKKGFTLIELVIVLAVLAIIALIAIPNFTRVRNESLIKADYRSAEQIEKITLMALANGDIPMPTEQGGKTYFVPKTDGKEQVPTEAEELFRDVKAPQLPSLDDANKVFKITITKAGEVTVGYESLAKFNGQEMTNLAGLNAAKPVPEGTTGGSSGGVGTEGPDSRITSTDRR